MPINTDNYNRYIKLQNRVEENVAKIANLKNTMSFGLDDVSSKIEEGVLQEDVKSISTWQGSYAGSIFEEVEKKFMFQCDNKDVHEFTKNPLARAQFELMGQINDFKKTYNAAPSRELLSLVTESIQFYSERASNYLSTASSNGVISESAITTANVHNNILNAIDVITPLLFQSASARFASTIPVIQPQEGAFYRLKAIAGTEFKNFKAGQVLDTSINGGYSTYTDKKRLETDGTNVSFTFTVPGIVIEKKIEIYIDSKKTIGYNQNNMKFFTAEGDEFTITKEFNYDSGTRNSTVGVTFTPRSGSSVTIPPASLQIFFIYRLDAESDESKIPTMLYDTEEFPITFNEHAIQMQRKLQAMLRFRANLGFDVDSRGNMDIAAYIAASRDADFMTKAADMAFRSGLPTYNTYVGSGNSSPYDYRDGTFRTAEAQLNKNIINNSGNRGGLDAYFCSREVCTDLNSFHPDLYRSVDTGNRRNVVRLVGYLRGKEVYECPQLNQKDLVETEGIEQTRAAKIEKTLYGFSRSSTTWADSAFMSGISEPPRLFEFDQQAINYLKNNTVYMQTYDEINPMFIDGIEFINQSN